MAGNPIGNLVMGVFGFFAGIIVSKQMIESTVGVFIMAIITGIVCFIVASMIPERT